jgi:predicted amidohydrolase YtcJ
MGAHAELILFNGRITTLDRRHAEVEAVAVRDGRFAAVGSESDVAALVASE